MQDICRHHGISAATLHSWRKNYGGMYAPDAKLLRELEAENDVPLVQAQRQILKRIVSVRFPDMTSMKEPLAKQLETPMAKCKAVGGGLTSEQGLSESRTCQIVGLSRSAQQYRPLP